MTTNGMNTASARAWLRLLGGRVKSGVGADLWDLFRAGPVGATRLLVASVRLGMPISDLLLIARLRRRMDDLALKTRREAAQARREKASRRDGK